MQSRSNCIARASLCRARACPQSNFSSRGVTPIVTASIRFASTSSSRRSHLPTSLPFCLPQPTALSVTLSLQLPFLRLGSIPRSFRLFSSSPRSPTSLSSAAFVDYYSLLGVTRSTPASEYKSSYYKLAKQYHPDAIASYEPKLREWCAKRFAQIGVAYGVLSDPHKKKDYDTFMDLTAIGDQDRMVHWMKRHRPPEQLAAVKQRIEQEKDNSNQKP